MFFTDKDPGLGRNMWIIDNWHLSYKFGLVEFPYWSWHATYSMLTLSLVATSCNWAFVLPMKSSRETQLCCTCALFVLTSSLSQPFPLASASKLAASPWNCTKSTFFLVLDWFNSYMYSTIAVHIYMAIMYLAATYTNMPCSKSMGHNASKTLLEQEVLYTYHCKMNVLFLLLYSITQIAICSKAYQCSWAHLTNGQMVLYSKVGLVSNCLRQLLPHLFGPVNKSLSIGYKSLPATSEVHYRGVQLCIADKHIVCHGQRELASIHMWS